MGKTKRPFRILFLPVDDGGCGWYRIRQIDEVLQGRKDVVSVLIDKKTDPADVDKLIKLSDVVVARPGDYEIVKLIKEEIDPRKPVIFDHDDNTLEVLPTSEHYREFGTEDAWAVVNGELKPIWVTGITKGFNRYKNLAGQMNLMYMLGCADMITSTVPNLLEYYLQFAGKETKGGVIPNCLNFDLYPEGKFTPADKKQGEIRIGWQGGVSHMGDWDEIREPLNRIMKDYPEVTLYVQGSYYKGQFEEFADRVIKSPWYPFKGYTFRLKLAGLDGAIIPLENKTFNEYKSEVKFSEFAALQVPIIVKDMLPYSRVAKDGENCWAYKSAEEFEVKFRDMLEDLKGSRKKANRYADMAYKWVHRHRDIRKEADNIIALYKQVLPEDKLKEIL